MKKFTYKKYKNCYFTVNSYAANKDAMAIAIENDTEGRIATCTVYYYLGIYTDNITTIKNYSENIHMTKFLKKLGIVTETLDRLACNKFQKNIFKAKDPETIDICIIDTNKLKEYCKSWNYNV